MPQHHYDHTCRMARSEARRRIDRVEVAELLDCFRRDVPQRRCCSKPSFTHPHKRSLIVLLPMRRAAVSEQPVWPQARDDVVRRRRLSRPNLQSSDHVSVRAGRAYRGSLGCDLGRATLRRGACNRSDRQCERASVAASGSHVFLRDAGLEQCRDESCGADLSKEEREKSDGFGSVKGKRNRSGRWCGHYTRRSGLRSEGQSESGAGPGAVLPTQIDGVPIQVAIIGQIRALTR